jgi:hypothetical protein
MSPILTLPAIQIRSAGPADAHDLLRLAALDSAPALGARVLLASADGELGAALDLDSGRAIADPFRPTADLVELLRMRARLPGASANEPRRRRWSLRRSRPDVALAR